MDIILKSSVNWCKHNLHQLTPLDPNKHPDEKVYRLFTDYHYQIIRDEKTKLPKGIALSYGPSLQVGVVDEQIGMPLKEICTAYNKSTGEESFLALIFEYDIPSNEETGIISQ